jgi:hypothetical protein
VVIAADRDGAVDRETGRPGDQEIRRSGDQETRGPGDQEIRGPGDQETRRGGGDGGDGEEEGREGMGWWVGFFKKSGVFFRDFFSFISRVFEGKMLTGLLGVWFLRV